MKDERQLRHVIDLARGEINQQRAPLARRYLDEINRDVEECRDPLLSAEYQLAYAEALAATNDPSSENEFQDALDKISNLPDRDPLLEMRCQEHFARHLRRIGRRCDALKHCESAKKLAVESRLFRDSARIQMLHILLTLEIDKSPQLPALQNLKQAARDGDFTPQEQLAAWMQYCGETVVKEQGLMFARGRGTVEYFRVLLKSVREEQRDGIPN